MATNGEASFADSDLKGRSLSQSDEEAEKTFKSPLTRNVLWKMDVR